MQSTNTLNFVDASLRAKMLGDAIPAESFAAGANSIGSFGEGNNINYHDFMNHGWYNQVERRWKHSDLKNAEYRYVQDAFKQITTEE